MKAGTTESMKFMVLKAKLRVPKYAVIGLLEGLWTLTASSAPDGAIGKFANIEIAAWLEWDGDADELVDALIAARFIDESDDHRLVIHDWADHAPNFIKGNLAKHGKEFVSAKQGAKQPAKHGAKQGARDGATKSSQVKSSQVIPNQDICAEQQSSSPPPAAIGTEDGCPREAGQEPDSETVIAIPITGGTEHNVLQTHVDEWAGLFPAVDVMQELRKMRAWCNSNPRKRKTKRGVANFITSWLSREQDKGSKTQARVETQNDRRVEFFQQLNGGLNGQHSETERVITGEATRLD